MAAPMSIAVARRLSSAALKLGTADPVRCNGNVRPLLERTFALPQGDERYANNALTPGAAPLEPSFAENEPGGLRFTLQPLGPDANGVDRRDEATREMRRMVNSVFGREALRWFDERSEEWRGFAPSARLNYGAFFGTAYDNDGLYSSKVYYETSPRQIEAASLLAVRHRFNGDADDAQPGSAVHDHCLQAQTWRRARYVPRQWTVAPGRPWSIAGDARAQCSTFAGDAGIRLSSAKTKCASRNVLFQPIFVM